jgi:hypothetical protein
MPNFWSKHKPPIDGIPLIGTYQVTSSATVDELVNLTDMSWHPLFSRTNVPNGLIPKPGLIFQAVSRLFPVRIRIFVERVQPRELISVRILALPGIEERMTYKVESTLYGTRVSYSLTLRGWLSPLIWSILRPYAEKVASELVLAVEREKLLALQPAPPKMKPNPDLLGLIWLAIALDPIVAHYTKII